MNNFKYLNTIGVLILALLFACDPMEDMNPGAGIVLPPDAGSMDFSITPGDDVFNFKVEKISPSIEGIYNVTFDLGNGSVVKEMSTNAYYPLPGDYTITMTITTNGGSTSISKTHSTSETDYSIFTDETYIALTGGIENTAGKTWVIDAESQGHLGVGSTGSDGLEWWSASPFTKEGTGAYDDEMTFKLEGFGVTLETQGVAYVKGYMKDDANLAGIYLNPRQNKDDWDVDYAGPIDGTWVISERDGKKYLSLNSDKRIFPGLDVGALNNEYEIVSISENYMTLTCFSAYENWTKWHFILRNKAYEKPKITYDVNVEAGTGANAYDVSLANAVIPAGQSIDKVVIDFGDGTVEETDNYMDVLSHVYMRKGSYMVKLTVTTSVETKESTATIDVTDNHPDYVEFLLGEMVMYNDFTEVQMAPVEGQDCFVGISDNPDRTYPNKSSKVGFYSKTDNQWANANMKLPAGYRFDLRQVSTFKIKVYGKAGDEVLLKLENTDKNEAWKTGAELKYTIQKDNTWEVFEYDFSGVGAGWNWTGEEFTSDITTDDRFNNGFYDIIRIMLNPGNGDGTHEFYFDELAGPHVEGIKSATRK